MAAGEIDSRYSYGRIWKIAYPILISLVMEQMIGMTDTAFLGRVGEIEIGASALAAPCRACHTGIWKLLNISYEF